MEKKIFFNHLSIQICDVFQLSQHLQCYHLSKSSPEETVISFLSTDEENLHSFFSEPHCCIVVSTLMAGAFWAQWLLTTRLPFFSVIPQETRSTRIKRSTNYRCGKPLHCFHPPLYTKNFCEHFLSDPSWDSWGRNKSFYLEMKKKRNFENVCYVYSNVKTKKQTSKHKAPGHSFHENTFIGLCDPSLRLPDPNFTHQ